MKEGSPGSTRNRKSGCTSADPHDPAVAVPGFIPRLLVGESQEDGTGRRQSGSDWFGTALHLLDHGGPAAHRGQDHEGAPGTRGSPFRQFSLSGFLLDVTPPSGSPSLFMQKSLHTPASSGSPGSFCEFMEDGFCVPSTRERRTPGRPADHRGTGRRA